MEASLSQPVEREQREQRASPAWWALPPEESITALASTPDGLRLDEARRRIDRYGRNELAEEGGVTVFALVARQFASPLIYILMIAAAVTLVLEEYVDAGVIGAVLILNAVIGFVQERRAEKSAEALRKLAVAQCVVLRERREVEIDSRELVPGDVVLVEAGSRVPADCRVLYAASLETDESLLTGESTTVAKDSGAVEDDAALADRTCMLFMGSVVTRGRGRALVVATGRDTQLGIVAGSVRDIGRVETPIQHRMSSFARIIGFAVLAASVIGFIVGILAGEDPEDVFLVLVALAVAVIPEGLPIVLTVTLAIGVNRMAARNVVIRRLPAVETLGSCTVIGSDKTGTLTQNRMTVQRISAGEQFRVTGSDHGLTGSVTLNGEPVDVEHNERLRLTLLAGALCNEAWLAERDGDVDSHGDPTEIALLISAARAGLMKEELEERYPRRVEIPFDSDVRFAATLNRDGDRDLLFVKGAPEAVLAMCDAAYGGDALDRDAVLANADAMAEEGLRVLAMAYRDFPLDDDADEVVSTRPRNLHFLGLQGMIDPPREEARAAVAACQDAGIRVIMITGDHATTGLAIARQLGIAKDDSTALSGRDLDGMDDDGLRRVVEEVPVYARVSPEHKHRVVTTLQSLGHVVAVTGDGVNDAPALKAADIGAAMGKSGTDVAKEAADMVVTDDNFASIFAAVEEGRIAFDNIRKVTFFLIATGIGTALAVLIGVSVGLGLPLLPAQLLWLNLVTNGIQDVALAFEPGEKGIIKRPPRPKSEGIISRLLWERTALVAMLVAAGTLLMFVIEKESGGSTERARTVALTTMVLFQVFHVGNSRSEYLSAFAKSPLSNRLLFVGTALALAIHAAALYLPPTQYILRVEPLDLLTWVQLAIVASSVIVVVEIHKFVRGGRLAYTGR